MTMQITPRLIGMPHRFDVDLQTCDACGHFLPMPAGGQHRGISVAFRQDKTFLPEFF